MHLKTAIISLVYNKVCNYYCMCWTKFVGVNEMLKALKALIDLCHNREFMGYAVRMCVLWMK